MLGWWSAVFLEAAAGTTIPAVPSPTESLSSCCSAVRTRSCPAELFAVGPGTTQASTPVGLVVNGGWTLRCASGATFEGDRSVTLSKSSLPKPEGTVLGSIEPAVAACFVASCVLPEGLCLRSDTAGVAVVSCAGGGVPGAAAWRNPPAVPATAPVTPAPIAHLDVALPPLPSLPCVPSPALREPSNAQVDEGNDAIVRGDLTLAADRYLAAITINRCNAYAWAALGDLLLQAGNPVPARPAFQAATGLMPAHFHAWTRLGEANERLGDRAAAKAAFEKALEARPGHPAAVAGLARTR